MDFRDTVTLVFKRSKFEVPRKLICARAKAVSRYCRTSGSDRFDVRGSYNDDGINTYLQLLYTGEVVMKGPSSVHDRCCHSIRDFVLLDELIDEFDDVVSKNLLTDTLVQFLRARGQDSPRSWDLYEELCMALHHAKAGPPVRKVLVCFLAGLYRSKEELEELGDRLEILAGLVMHHQTAIAEGKAGRSFADVDAKQFHVETVLTGEEEEDDDDED